MTTVREALVATTARLRAAGYESPRLDAEVLLQSALGWDRVRLLVALAEVLPLVGLMDYEALIARRLAGEPVAYLTGEREFMGLTLSVGPGVLVPRPETECLVEWIVAHARAARRWAIGLRIADVGTGSGAIALSLGAALPQARVVATERSAAALAYARANRARLGLAGRVALVRGDLLAPVGPVDIIAANLPYLRPDQLHDGISREPAEALVSGVDGLNAYRALLPQAAALLRSPGLLAAEIDPSQAGAMAALCQSAFPASAVAVERDLAGLDRFVTVARGG